MQFDKRSVTSECEPISPCCARILAEEQPNLAPHPAKLRQRSEQRNAGCSSSSAVACAKIIVLSQKHPCVCARNRNAGKYTV